jgi:hypothetical protein
LPANGNKNGKPDNLATVMTEVSERVTVLVKEELELAKAEVQQKVSSLSKGLIAGAIGAVFALLLVPFALLALAWGLNSLLTSIWLGFVIVAGLLLVLMGGAFLFAWRKIKVGTPAPTMAIEEAKKIRETVSAKGNANGNGASRPAAIIPPPVVTAPLVPAPAPVLTPAAPAPASTATAEAPTVTAEAPAETADAPTEPADAPTEPADAPAEPADAPTATFDAATDPDDGASDAAKSE